MDSANQLSKVITWNVRGLNNVAKQEEVKQVMTVYKLDLICIQETKMSIIDDSLIRNSLGMPYENNYCYLPAEGTRGGILLAANDSCLTLSNSWATINTITATVTDARNNYQWTVTGVYGPQGDLEKKRFIRELRHLKQQVTPQWLLLGDFNLIYKDQDKNRGRLNRRLMLKFRRALNHLLEVKEVELTGRKFTWSNQQESPNVTRIDRVFYNSLGGSTHKPNLDTTFLFGLRS